jgi:hypothetical protein
MKKCSASLAIQEVQIKTSRFLSYQSERLSCKKRMTTNDFGNIGQKKLYRINMEFSQKKQKSKSKSTILL